MRSYTNVHVKFFIKGNVIIIHGITCVSNDIIDDVIIFANFSVADVLKLVKKWHFDQKPFLERYFLHVRHRTKEHFACFTVYDRQNNAPGVSGLNSEKWVG